VTFKADVADEIIQVAWPEVPDGTPEPKPPVSFTVVDAPESVNCTAPVLWETDPDTGVDTPAPSEELLERKPPDMDPTADS
jgi:hypothetical protein